MTTIASGSAATIAAYVDEGGALGGIWTTYDGTTLARATTDGVTYAPPMQVAASGVAVSSAVAAGPGTIVLAGGGRATVAWLDAATGRWSVYAPLVGDFVGGVGARGDMRELVVATIGPARGLVAYWFSDATWSPGAPQADTHVFLGTELGTSPPAVFRYGDGTPGVFYLDGSQALAATTIGASAAAPPVKTPIPESVTFTAEATPTVGGAVAIVRTIATGELLALPFSRSAGWGAPILIDRPPVSDTETLAVAPGVCGEDVLVAYAATDGVRAARVKVGYAPAIKTVVRTAADETVGRVAIASRRR
jgi:hypothetical protein